METLIGHWKYDDYCSTLCIRSNGVGVILIMCRRTFKMVLWKQEMLRGLIVNPHKMRSFGQIRFKPHKSLISYAN